jgi:methionyl-tRNA formyltransferase
MTRLEHRQVELLPRLGDGGCGQPPAAPGRGVGSGHDPDQRVKLGPLTSADGALPPGEVVAGRQAVVVGTGTAALRLGTVQAVGKRPMPAADWARGLRLSGGEGFE